MRKVLALSLFGDKNRVILENKARYNKSERKKRRMQIREMRDRGYSVKQISEELNIPLKTVYRWLSRESNSTIDELFFKIYV